MFDFDLPILSIGWDLFFITITLYNCDTLGRPSDLLYYILVWKEVRFPETAWDCFWRLLLETASGDCLQPRDLTLSSFSNNEIIAEEFKGSVYRNLVHLSNLLCSSRVPTLSINSFAENRSRQLISESKQKLRKSQQTTSNSIASLFLSDDNIQNSVKESAYTNTVYIINPL